jgi:RimJ/RimL family protein N-acetyltransferase
MAHVHRDGFARQQGSAAREARAVGAVTRLVTERLILEPVGERNAVTLWRVMQSAHLRRYQDVPRLGRAEFVRRVASRPRRFDGLATGRFEWLIRVRSQETPIGWVSLRVGENPKGSAEIGYSIIVSARRNGYAGEAVRAIVDAAFCAPISQVDACCVVANAASRRLLERAGFAYMRVQANGAVVRGKPVDICIYRLSRDAWEAMRSAAGYGSSANSMVTSASS